MEVSLRSLVPVALSAIIALCVGQACADATNVTIEGLRIATPGQRDTALAPMPNMVVEYRDSAGRPRAGITVHVESVYGRVLLEYVGGVGYYQQDVIAPTDASGRVVVGVVLGPVAGTAWVRATAIDLGLSDSVSYTVLPGAVARVGLGPIDTAVYVGNTVALRARPTDRWGNARTGDLVQWSVGSGIVEATQPGVFRGLAFGRASVHAHVGSVRDSVQLSVVPRGTLAGGRTVFNTDGSGFQTLDIAAGCSDTWQWAPSGTALVFAAGATPGSCNPQRLFTVGFPGGTATKLIQDSTGLLDEYWPWPSNDGQWIYFTGQPGNQNGEIWRVRWDGTGAARIGPAAGFDDMDQAPAPSPDNTRVLYWSVRQGETTNHLRVIDLATLTVSDLGISGTVPAWSPSGDSIAFMRADSTNLPLNRYYIARSDGQGVRFLVEVGYTALQPAWSPDGRWIATLLTNGHVGLVEVATGMILPLGWTSGPSSLTWRPQQR